MEYIAIGKLGPEWLKNRAKSVIFELVDIVTLRFLLEDFFGAFWVAPN